jgi:NAD(P)H-hydrate repair Nnr-like enzyme with NAD(P)H-hydrate epimerase domain
MKVLTSEQMRKAEQESAKLGISPGMLMENAGRVVAEQVERILGGVKGKSILMLIG